ncbi:MFS transporter [Streptomyces noursei]|uniref:MFS transporter n=1 Tax=Streptomyces noursei TaxID=1971 RepID=UPI0030EFE07B
MSCAPHDARADAPPAAPRGRRTRLTLALLAFAHLIIGLDYNIVFVALPGIAADVDFTAQNLQWVVSGYTVAFGGFLLLGGRACDLFGRRRMFTLGLVLYAVSSLAGTLATTPGLLVAARAGQGIGGAFLTPATLSLVTSLFAEGRERNRALSVWGGAAGCGMVLGSLLGGVLTETFGWEAVFLVNVPLAALGIALAAPLIPADGTFRRGRVFAEFDLYGTLTGTAGATLLVLALVQGPESGWTAPAVLISGAAAIVLLLAFLVIERRGRNPLMPLHLFRNRNLSTGTAVTFTFMATFGVLAYFLTLYFQNVHGFSAMQTGIAFVVPCAGVLVGTAVGGRLATRFGMRATLIGSLVLGVAGTVAFALSLSPDASFTALLPGLSLLSLAQGVVYTTMYAAAMTGVDEGDQGIASGIASTGEQVGSAVGLAVLVALANAGTRGLTGEELRTATSDGVRAAVLAAAAGMVLMILICANFRKGRRVPATEGPAAATPAGAVQPETVRTAR